MAAIQPQTGLALESYRLAQWPVAAPKPGFHLVDMSGHRRSSVDYTGRVSIVLFGFTHCPDICPGELLKLSQVFHKLGPLASRVKLLFISLDSERDTPGLLKDYVAAFDPEFIGLTGSNVEINDAAASFSVQFAKVPIGKGYTIDHSTGIYVLDQSGHVRLVGTLQTSVDDWVHDLRLLLGA
jgi:protein SCO1/2